jgi:hypothetical protein
MRKQQQPPGFATQTKQRGAGPTILSHSSFRLLGVRPFPFLATPLCSQFKEYVPSHHGTRAAPT